MTDQPPADYTAEQLAVDLGVKVTKLVERLTKLERIHAAVKNHLANPKSATAEFELANALKDAE